MKAKFHHVNTDFKNRIVYLHDDSNKDGGMSITNDAENVVIWCREMYGNNIRIVYTDTDNELWEIVWKDTMSILDEVRFERWHGLAWDILKRPY